MADDSDPRRDAIHEVLQGSGPEEIDRPAVLVGWTVVCEWMDDQGDRWLSKAHSSSITTWGANGMHHEALFGQWPSDEDE